MRIVIFYLLLGILSVGLALVEIHGHRWGGGAFDSGVAVLAAVNAWLKWKKLP